MQNALDTDPIQSVGLLQVPPPVRSSSQPKPVWKIPPGVSAYGGIGTTPPSKLVPPSLPEGIKSVTEIKGEWFAIHSRVDLRGTRDAAVAWSLFLSGLPFFYPQEQVWITEGKARPLRRLKTRSLFSGYLFASGRAARNFCGENSSLIDAVLNEPREGQIERDLSLIQHAIAENPQLTTDKLDRPGTRVRVKRGPFMDFEGVVDFSLVKRDRVVVHCFITFMGRSLPKEFDVSDLYRI